MRTDSAPAACQSARRPRIAVKGLYHRPEIHSRAKISASRHSLDGRPASTYSCRSNGGQARRLARALGTLDLLGVKPATGAADTLAAGPYPGCGSANRQNHRHRRVWAGTRKTVT